MSPKNLLLAATGIVLLGAIATRFTPEATGQTGAEAAQGDGWAVEAFPAAAAPAAPAAGRLNWQILENPNGPHTALILDPTRQVFAVYHVDPASGEIKMRSVRNLSFDLRLLHHNTSTPTPKDVQLMLEDAGGGK